MESRRGRARLKSERQGPLPPSPSYRDIPPLGIHDSRGGEDRSGAKSGPSHGQAERQSLTRFQVTPNAIDLMLIQLGGTLPRELTGHYLYRI
jgi:hypothetical protein